ncbi:Uncharacterised protein (plasmid) [Tsukamurella tyrosinosolvens]|uniref:Uncharacterized protein n=1 Tax=Tsukamurella tyrosinosolvens TaxID=57704 RepID=A0A1H4VS36_TSUTY|nr:hypothetical protein [Tsukamurella tyrosinosolvens]KXO90911.1 hypothetical protein AXK58_20985 [Tsukamurella tyrosinosolvens]SEC83328.1 hypothetical protein SAMN04489793_3305 [Tsukamurella tyrosinosolvens]VEH90362.1 Uncharacterised protein [Tsukamurella tyrosinosolvens]
MSNNNPSLEAVLVYPAGKDTPVRYDSVSYDEVDRNGTLHLAHADNTRGEIRYVVWASGFWSHMEVVDADTATAAQTAS